MIYARDDWKPRWRPKATTGAPPEEPDDAARQEERLTFLERRLDVLEAKVEALKALVRADRIAPLDAPDAGEGAGR